MEKKECFLNGIPVENTSFGYTLSLISGKYAMITLYILAMGGTMRHNELKRSIGKISFKTLSYMLKQLEANGLIIRKEYSQVPPKVEYSLSKRGESIIPVLNALCQWGEENRYDARTGEL